MTNFLVSFLSFFYLWSYVTRLAQNFVLSWVSLTLFILMSHLVSPLKFVNTRIMLNFTMASYIHSTFFNLIHLLFSSLIPSYSHNPLSLPTSPFSFHGVTDEPISFTRVAYRILGGG